MTFVKNIFLKYYLCLLLFLLASCEKEITVDLPEPEQKIVVEGWIDQNDYATVILTKNMAYFGVVDSASLVAMVNFPAVVTVSDGTNTETLVKTFNFNYFPPIIYKGSLIKGEVGKTYFLTVNSEGKELTAKTTILPSVKFDSLWFELEADEDSLGSIWAKFTDNANEKNYYRVFTQRKGRDNRMIPVMGSVYDDFFFNGLSFTFNMYRGQETYTDYEGMENDDEYAYFKLGDTVVVKACAIDKEHYDFWSTAEIEFFSGGNPFMNPMPVKSNIKGGGLGVWGGYGTNYDTLVIN